MKAHLYIEGGESKEDQIRCREGFRKLLDRAGFFGRMPRLSACGGRESVYSDFKTAFAKQTQGDYIAMLVDSEDPVDDVERTWDHLYSRDGWPKPSGALDDQVLLMTTSMETWIVADRSTLNAHYGQHLHENALPPLVDLERRDRKVVHDQLVHATRDCSNAFAKGKRSFEVLAELDPAVLIQYLPSFSRVKRVLAARL